MQFLPKKSFEHDKKLLFEHTDSINSLHECKNGSFTGFSSIHKTKSYIQVTGCLFDYIITSSSLSVTEKLYYLVVESLASINAATDKQRAVALSANKWSAKLNCSKSQIFAMQKKLAGQ